jgi:hypothetical protein
MPSAQIMMNGETVAQLSNGGFSILVVTESPAGNGGVVSFADPQFSTEMSVEIDSDERALLFFANMPMNVGTPISTLPAPGMMLDLTQVSDPQVTYDVNEGWGWGGLPWGTEVNPGTEVQQLLAPSSGTRLA